MTTLSKPLPLAWVRGGDEDLFDELNPFEISQLWDGRSSHPLASTENQFYLAFTQGVQVLGALCKFQVKFATLCIQKSSQLGS